jgi:hypothetical protein
MVALRDRRVARGFHFEIEHVRGHASDAGNIEADKLARAGAEKDEDPDDEDPDWDELLQAELEVLRIIKPVVPDAGLEDHLVMTFDASDLLDGAGLMAELAEA